MEHVINKIFQILFKVHMFHSKFRSNFEKSLFKCKSACKPSHNGLMGLSKKPPNNGPKRGLYAPQRACRHQRLGLRALTVCVVDFCFKNFKWQKWVFLGEVCVVVVV